MSLRSLITAAAYRLTGSVSFHVSSLLPESAHPGKRVGRALQDLRDAPSGPYFMRAVLESRWRSRLLLSHVLALSPSQLRRFFEDRVLFEGAVLAAPMLDGTRPVILAAPHYGPAPIGYVAAVHRVGAHRPINLFYDSSRTPPRLNRLFERSGVDTNTLLGSFTGVVAAMRALERNEWLVMMPDAFDDITHTIAVPFFGRMLRVAAGTAFFALRADALVVPVFATPAPRLGMRVTLGRPIDSRRFFSFDEPQSIFMLTRALFTCFERELRRTPEHWHNWEIFPRVSRAITPPGRLEDDAPMRLLRDKCMEQPQLLRDLPELELLLK
jgi:lauroyl/myristoyl acyltransferase